MHEGVAGVVLEDVGVIGVGVGVVSTKVYLSYSQVVMAWMSKQLDLRVHSLRSTAKLGRVASASHIAAFISDSGIVDQCIAAKAFASILQTRNPMPSCLATRSALKHRHIVSAGLQHGQNTSINAVGEATEMRGTRRSGVRDLDVQ